MVLCLHGFLRNRNSSWWKQCKMSGELVFTGVQITVAIRFCLWIWYSMIYLTCAKKLTLEYEVVGSIPRGRPKKTWLEVVQRDAKYVD